jgi:hypothetical protein
MLKTSSEPATLLVVGLVPHLVRRLVELFVGGLQFRLTLAVLIRLQRIYNFLFFHSIIASILDVFYAIIYHFL